MTTQYRVAILEHHSWQPPVKAADLTAPPAMPTKGDRYIVAGPTASGAWAGHEGSIAWCSNATGPVWSFDAPEEGWRAYDQDNNADLLYDGAAWGPAVDVDVSGKADLAVPSQASNLAGLTAGGNLEDSGIAAAGVSAAVAAVPVYDGNLKCLTITL